MARNCRNWRLCNKDMAMDHYTFKTLFGSFWVMIHLPATCFNPGVDPANHWPPDASRNLYCIRRIPWTNGRASSSRDFQFGLVLHHHTLMRKNYCYLLLSVALTYPKHLVPLLRSHLAQLRRCVRNGVQLCHLDAAFRIEDRPPNRGRFQIGEIFLFAISNNYLFGVTTSTSAWWFGTFFIFPYIGSNHPNWRTPSFFRGVRSNHQPVFKSFIRWLIPIINVLPSGNLT